ncbi:MAG: hypothetical protein IH898_00135 [Planctomycetes bacterium]|nr:hypothetical protein [Planctomycetota bacterium]
MGLAISWGCAQNNPSPAVEPGVTATPRAAVQLTLLVVDDPELAAGASLLRGEWAERSGGELVVQEMTLDEMLAAKQFSADAIVYPSRHVGTLVARDWLRPVRDSVLKSDDFALGDLLPLVRNESMRYAGRIFGVSLGEPPLMMAWQMSPIQNSPTPDAVALLPDTWEKLDRLLPLETIEDDLAAELIVRAASYVDRQHRAELLFDPQSMAPRLTSPPVVRALESMVARSNRTDRTAARTRFTWPTAGALEGESPWHFAALPRAASVFDSIRDRWEPQTGGRPLTVLGFGGRLVSVTRASRNATSAFKLLAWLTTGNTATQLSSRSQATVWFRNSQKVQAHRWLADRGGEQVARLVTRLLSSDSFYLLPRIPGIDRYLQSLNEAVVRAVRGELPPDEALESVAAQWNALTKSLGPREQRLAYRRHLGLAEVVD